MIRWPGIIKAGTEVNSIVCHEDWVPTLVAAAGEPKVKEKLLTGYEAAGKTFKVHLDGYDLRSLLDGSGADPRKEFFYWTDDGNLAAVRYDRWKLLFLQVQPCPQWPVRDARPPQCNMSRRAAAITLHSITSSDLASSPGERVIDWLVQFNRSKSGSGQLLSK
jgi:arylsulfatase A-like enzyme